MKRQIRAARYALPLLAALTLTACGSDGGTNGIATAGGPAGQPSPSSSAAKLSDSERALRFAQCMREHGIDMPDPGPGERVRAFANGDRKKMDAAMQACKEYAPFNGEPPKLDAAQMEKLREHAKCMRANGVPNFPDPDPNGLIKIGPDSGINPDDPKLKAAEEKCRGYLPGPRVETRGGDK